MCSEMKGSRAVSWFRAASSSELNNAVEPAVESIVETGEAM